MKDLLTVSEAAKIAGITTQAIYKRLDGDLKSFVQLSDGKKMLKKEALSVINTGSATKEDASNKLTDSMVAAVAMLTEQLTVKDRQIAELNERLAEAQQLQRNSQVLLLQEQTSSLPPPPPPKKNIIDRIFRK